MRFAFGIAFEREDRDNLEIAEDRAGIWLNTEVWGMAISRETRQQLKALAGEIINQTQQAESSGGRRVTFADIEEDAIEVTDLLAQMLIEERLARQISPLSSTVCCPACQNEIARDDEEPRAMQTNRGEVTWTEPTYHCPTCRRSFFPGELRIGD